MDESFWVYRKTCRSEEKECDIKADFIKKTVKEKVKEKRRKERENKRKKRKKENYDKKGKERE